MNFIARLRRSDSAVSPVIAVILMVAITVVLAATVYVWVSGFGSAPTNPAKSISLTSAGSISHADDDDVDAVSDFSTKNYTVSAGTAGMRWTDLTFTINGAPLDYAATPLANEGSSRDYRNESSATTGPTFCVMNGETCAASATAAGVVSAGQTLRVTTTYSSATLPTLGASPTLRVLDSQANSVIYTLNIG